MLIAIIVGIVATFWANLDITFRNGAVAKAGGFKGWVGRESFGRLQRWLHNPSEPNLIGIGFMGIGALLTFVMMYMRMHFLWWPFHPAGYALAISFAMDYFWFAFFVAWLLKYLILRHGGLRLHRRVAPLFLGLILGDYNIVSLINVAQTFQFAKMCHKLKVCATIHASRIRNGVSERNRNDLSNSRYNNNRQC